MQPSIVFDSTFPLASVKTRDYAAPFDITAARAALVVAHPSHELRLYRWLQLSRPGVFVLTDGSGRAGQSRLNATTHLLADVGATPGTIYGRMTDAESYAAMLRKDVNLFVALAVELAEAFERGRIEYVAGDAVEGYNSTHDVCRLVINAAVALINKHRSNRIANFDFPVVGKPDDCPPDMRAQAIQVWLDEKMLERKLTVARCYHPSVASDVEKAVNEIGIDAFRTEWLRPIADGRSYNSAPEGVPFYEAHAAKQVAAGHYTSVVSYREHIAPIADALGEYVEGRA
ncbi:MAG TPA: hypothetical protein VM943_08720 [Pyrinomonadaceae bacterium]|nr:hypothetical protein [Pyrinomonadaceae bacterium]